MEARKIWMAVGLVIALFAKVSLADNFIWWEATPASPGASVASQGMGRALELDCDPALQGGDPYCEWDIVMRLRNSEAMFGWATDLSATHTSVEVASYQYGEPQFGKNGQFIGYLPFNYPMTPLTEIGSGSMLITNSAAITLAGAPTYNYADDYTAWSVFQFRLVKLSVSTDPGLVEIFGNTGAVEIAGEVNGVFNAVVADNAESNISLYPTPYLQPVIIVHSPQGPDYMPGVADSDGIQPPLDDPGRFDQDGIADAGGFGFNGGTQVGDNPPRASGIGGAIGGSPDSAGSMFDLCGPSTATMLELTLVGFVCARLARGRGRR